MTPSYFTRLVLLSRPRHSAPMLLALRLLPAAFSVLIVAVLCIPSYLRFEPRIVEEEVDFACLAAAILGACIGALAIYKALSALIRTALYVRRCGGVEARIEGETVLVVKQSAGLALAGILHPRLMVSEEALRDLSSDQLAIALRHERAHRESRDNLKRLLILLAPPIFPRLRLLDQAWAKCTEWAADDRAAQGDDLQSATLAGALVRVARLQTHVVMPALVTSLVEADEDLSVRVDRLLAAVPVRESSMRGAAIAASVLMLAIVSTALNSGSLRGVHHLLERLLD
jgi:beta-lactamase regulating signal transducer with metallopeptidase domain